MPGKQGGLTLEQYLESPLDILILGGRNGQYRITQRLIDLLDILQKVQIVFFFYQIDLVDHQSGGDSKAFGTDQKPINKSQGCPWASQRNDQKSLINVGSQDMRKVGFSGRFSDDVILPWLYGHNDRRGLVLDRKSTRLNSSHVKISYAVFCLKKKKQINRLKR